ncbi:MAG: chorismate mutase [Alphaproteobacteria bacterium]
MSSSDIDSLRAELDTIDEEMMRLLGERFGVTRRVGALKKANGHKAVDPAREAAQDARIRRQAAAVGIDGDLAVAVMRLVRARVVEDHRAMGVGD